jgi:hypothetical protein
MDNERLPTIEEAENILLWANSQNPGPWMSHSKVVANTAKIIAQKCDLNENIAYILGLLHDIGRYEGITGLRHIIAGYELMNNKGYNLNAKICLTHSFPIKDLEAAIIKNDCTKEEVDKIENKIINYEYNDYDKLIQLCDSICMAEGVCILEIRLIDVARRYNVKKKKILEKWNAFFEIKKYFDKKCGISIYNLFYEEIIKNCVK